MKYEAITHTRENKSYGIWNNDMQAFQYIYDWGGTETISLETTNKVAADLNSQAPDEDTEQMENLNEE